MGDKKRKLTEAVAEEPIAPEVKKMKKEKKEKKEKREAEKDAATAATTAPTKTAEEGPQEQDVKETKPKKERLDQKQRREKKERKKLEKKEKREKKEKLKNGNPDADEDERRAKKERKDQKYNNKKKVKKADVSSQSAEAPEEEAVNGDAEPSNEEGTEEGAEGKSARFICFVGNLPYSANDESMKKHFEKNPPTSIRVATKKEDNKKCRGFAFIEFDNFDRMKSCLKLYHHSTFDDGKYPPRAINVELTAGGGGNTEYRKGKIEAKNKKLFEERQRNAQQIQKDKKKHEKSGKKGSGANTVGLDGANDAPPAEDDKFANVHPSRRPRMW